LIDRKLTGLHTGAEFHGCDSKDECLEAVTYFIGRRAPVFVAATAGVRMGMRGGAEGTRVHGLRGVGHPENRLAATSPARRAPALPSRGCAGVIASGCAKAAARLAITRIPRRDAGGPSRRQPARLAFAATAGVRMRMRAGGWRCGHFNRRADAPPVCLRGRRTVAPG
jgi:hypothetical protein